jgi:hypothetical protein
MKVIKFLGIVLLGILSAAYGGGPDVAPVVTVQKKQAATVQNLFHCPSISALKKDPETRTWFANAGWKSYDLSFVDKVTRFSGAQWRGTNVGQIFCVYRGESETDFPILLAYKILTYMPAGGEWSPNLGGYKNCETPLQENCPFSIRVQASTVDMYEQAEQLKKSAPQQSRPGF